MSKKEASQFIAYTILSLIVSFVPTTLFVSLHHTISSINPIGYFVITWLIVNLVSVLQLLADGIIAMGYVLLFLLGDEDEKEIKA